MSGRTLILVLIVSSALMGWFFYQTLQQSPQFKTLATEQMEAEYIDYVKTFQNTDRLVVTEVGATKFFAPLTSAWKFEIQDKTLVAFVPALKSEPANQAPTPEILAKAQETIQQSLRTWLEDKYHTQKDLLVEVHLEKAP